MPVTPDVLKALDEAVAAAPANGPLRLHLARLLLDAGRPADALSHCQIVLTGAPDDRTALAIAGEAARAAGDVQLAEAYSRLLSAAAGPQLDSAEDLPAPDASTAATAGEQLGGVLPIRVLEGGGSGSDANDVEVPPVRLADVGGMEQVKQRLQIAFLGPMQNPRLREMYGKSLRGGLLLFGPPGCGKTFIARATAGELGARFIAVGISDVLDMWFGQSERNLHELFETARRSAPCVLFLDELDALGQKRTQARHQPLWRSLVAQMLNEMDSVAANNEGVFVLGATNAPWDVDTALRRPGRFDRSILVLPPDREARKAILAYHLRDRPVVAGLSLDVYSARTEGYSGADLAHICESAAEFALGDSLATGQARPIDGHDLDRALKEVRPSTGAWFQTARNFAMFANEGGVYDDLLAYMRMRGMS